MESKQTLHNLGFRRRSRKKKKSRKGAGKEQTVRPPTSTTLDGLLNRYHNMQINPPPGAPHSDTDINSGGHDGALLEKGDEGFAHYLTGKWRTGYPRVEEG